MSAARKVALLGVLGIWIISVVFATVPPIAQDVAYHHFSDARGWSGIPNFGDVMSNLAFVPAGLYGLWMLVRCAAPGPWHRDARLPLAVFFVGVICVAPGSAYYHWLPSNDTLFWDRLPMTVAFMGLTAAVITDRISASWGNRVALPLLLLTGAATVVYWRMSEAQGAGDLRAYALVQFLPMVMIPLLLWLFKGGRYIGWRALAWAFVFYGLAKGAEHFDPQIFEALGGVVSGHTMKHVFAAAAPAAIAWRLRP